MTDQRDLAKEVEPFMQLLTEAAVEGVECTISNEMARSLSDFIASQSRELERLKAELEISWDDLPGAIDALDDVIPQGCQQLLRQCAKELRAMRAENERLQTAFDQAVFENSELEDQLNSQSRELEEMRNSIKALVDGPPAQMSSPLGFLPINSTGMRTLVDEVCKLQSQLAALRRPVVQSDEIAMALYELDAAVHASCIQDGDYSPVKVIRDALDQAQREIARWVGTHHGWQTELERVMGERDAALAKVERLEQDERESFKRAESFEKAYAGACERVERLEGAARRVVDEWDRDPQCRVDVPAIGKLRLELAAADGQQSGTFLGRQLVVDPSMPADQLEIRSGRNNIRVTNLGTGDGVEGE